RHGAIAPCWTLDKLRPLPLTADDCGLVLDATAGAAPAAATAPLRHDRYADREPGRPVPFAVARGTLRAAQPAVRETHGGGRATPRRGVRQPDPRRGRRRPRRSRERGRVAVGWRAVRLHGGGAAGRPAVQGPRVGRKHRARRRARMAGADRLPPAPPAAGVRSP